MAQKPLYAILSENRYLGKNGEIIMKECDNCGMELPDDWPYDLCPDCLDEEEENDETFMAVGLTDNIGYNF